MKLAERVSKHAKLTWKATEMGKLATPSFLVLFINSICNLKCDHCFYWQNLNQRNDLSLEEIKALARELEPFDNLNLSGGEPFLRKEFAEICRFFITNNGVKEIYVPTNGWYTDKTITALESIFEEESLRYFVAELSIDGMPEYHDKFRGAQYSFKKLIETYDKLAEFQKKEPRLRIHSISTATNQNIEQIKELTTYLYERCPAMDHHNLAVIRGDRKDPSLLTPGIAEYQGLYEYIRRLWAPREEGRYGSIVEPMLQWAKMRTLEQKRQVVPCKAGVISAVVYANGDVSVCEMHTPLGNLRNKTFREMWFSPEAQKLRQQIAARECWCTTEVFLWSSIVYQPTQLAKAMLGGKVWESPSPLRADEQLKVVPEEVNLNTPALTTHEKH